MPKTRKPLPKPGFVKMTVQSPYLNRAAIDDTKQAVAQMADDFRVVVVNTGGVMESDLELLGWTPAQIEAHGKAAARLARSQSDRVAA